MKKFLSIALSIVLSASLIPVSYALKSDRDQPATLDADEFDMDFQTGVRTYRGNVIYRQGSIRLFADELVAYFAEGELQRAVARGNLARFRQLPDDGGEEMVGVALRIELDDVNQLVTLQDKAQVTQGTSTVTGKRIVYNMATERVNVTSGTSVKKPTESKAGDSEAKTGGDSAEQGSVARPRIVIQPKN